MKIRIKSLAATDPKFGKTSDMYTEQRYGIPVGTELEVLDSKPVISTVYNTPEIPHWLCRLPDGNVKLVICSDAEVTDSTLPEDKALAKEIFVKAYLANLETDRDNWDDALACLTARALRYTNNILETIKKL